MKRGLLEVEKEMNSCINGGRKSSYIYLEFSQAATGM